MQGRDLDCFYLIQERENNLTKESEESKSEERGLGCTDLTEVSETMPLHAGHREKAYGIRGVIHLFNKRVLSNHYVSRVTIEFGASGIE